MQVALIFGLMVLGTLAKLASILRIAISRLALRYPLFTLMTVFSAVRTMALLAAMAVGETVRFYPQIWARTESLTLVLQVAACVEGFWIVAFHFRNIKAFGTILLALIGALGVIVGYRLVAGWSGNWNAPLTGAVVLLQRVGFVLIVIALLTRLFFKQFSRVPIKPNAIRHLAVLTLLFGSFFVGGFAANGAVWIFVFNVAMTLGVFAAYSWWALCMTPHGEELPFAMPALLSPQEFEAADSVDGRKMDQAVRGARAIHDQLR